MYISAIYTSTELASTIAPSIQLTSSIDSTIIRATFGSIRFGFTKFGREIIIGSNLINSKIADSVEVTSQLNVASIQLVSPLEDYTS